MSLIARHSVLSIGDAVARCDIVPEAGGALASFSWELGRSRIDWLRPAGAGAIAAGRPDGMACFPLVPWGGRIRDGRFQFCGREARLDGADAHALHGHGWRRPWSVVERSASAATLEYRHEPDAWPWAYRARQHVAVEGGALALALEIENLSDALMPAGLGFHPYFPWSEDLALEAPATGVWRTDADNLPCAHDALPEAWDFAAPRRAAALDIDHVFTGWTGRASLHWPERKARLAIEADWPMLSFLGLFMPEARDYFCVEPMSQCADAINIARQGGAATGLRVLAPGATRRAGIRLIPVCAPVCTPIYN